MLKATPRFSVIRQCDLLTLPHSSAHARPQGISETVLELMRQINKLYLKGSLYGTRHLRDHLQQLGQRVNRKRIQRLLQQIGIRAVYPKPRKSQTEKGHKIYPYLLRELNSALPN